MSEQMEFPITFERFAKEYGFKDDKEVYTNGSDLIPIFRVKQWLEQDNKLRTMEIDTAYECGKHANKWIPCSEKLPENKSYVLTTIYIPGRQPHARSGWYQDGFFHNDNGDVWRTTDREVIAWQPLPQPYIAESEE